MKNYYRTLGIEPTATQTEVRAAYYKLSKKFHPDLNNNDPYFESLFREILEAYACLSDPNKRAAHDQELGLTKSFTQEQEPSNASDQHTTKQQDYSYSDFETEEIKQEEATTNKQTEEPQNKPTEQETAEEQSWQKFLYYIIPAIGLLLMYYFFYQYNKGPQDYPHKEEVKAITNLSTTKKDATTIIKQQLAKWNEAHLKKSTQLLYPLYGSTIMYQGAALGQKEFLDKKQRIFDSNLQQQQQVDKVEVIPIGKKRYQCFFERTRNKEGVFETDAYELIFQEAGNTFRIIGEGIASGKAAAVIKENNTAPKPDPNRFPFSLADLEKSVYGVPTFKDEATDSDAFLRKLEKHQFKQKQEPNGVLTYTHPTIKTTIQIGKNVVNNVEIAYFFNESTRPDFERLREAIKQQYKSEKSKLPNTQKYLSPKGTQYLILEDQAAKRMGILVTQSPLE